MKAGMEQPAVYVQQYPKRADKHRLVCRAVCAHARSYKVQGLAAAVRPTR